MNINYYNIYKEAHNNAVELLNEAKILLKNDKYARAYFLAFTALEEISKSQLAADVYTGFYDEQKYLDIYFNHNKKINMVSWAKYEADDFPMWIGPDIDDVVNIQTKLPNFKKRNNALYIGHNKNGKLLLPKKEISIDDVWEIIHIVETAIYKIVETKLLTERIGTKGFLK